MAKKIGEGLGISGFTLGVLSIILAGVLGIIVSITGFVFSVIQQKNNPTKLGKAGVILNIIGFLLSIVLLLYVYPILQQQLGALPI